MDLNKKVHLLMTSECNNDCTYCFRPIYEEPQNYDTVIDIAYKLVENGAEHVTIGGGEPTIIPVLPEVLGILKDADVYTELHTNGRNLNSELLDKFDDNLDKIALPINSLDARTQRRLEGDYFSTNLKKSGEIIKRYGIDLDFHTVATAINMEHIPNIYPLVKSIGFDKWHIYLFNPELAWKTNLSRKVSDKSKMKRMKQIETLAGRYNPKNGGIDHIYARLLKVEEKMMKEINDECINFYDYFNRGIPYLFITSAGGALFSQKRVPVGNILKNTPEQIKRKVDDFDLDEDFFENVWKLPLFTRIWTGDYEWEEVEEVREAYWPEMHNLQDLHEGRQERIEGVS